MADPRSTQVFLNGINAATGRYYHQPQDIGAIASKLGIRTHETRFSAMPRRSAATPPPPGRSARMSLVGADDSHVDLRTGWAIVFAEDESEEVKRALRPLISRRRKQVEGTFKVLEPYSPNHSWTDWLGAHDAIPGVLDTSKIPYYIALVGGPDRIPYGFQSLMDVEYAVGRIAFETVDEYAAYAESVVRYETAASAGQGKWAGFFGTAHKDDPATQGSADHLVEPLTRETWDVRKAYQFLREDATKANLLGMLHAGAEKLPPAVLFTATHGAGFPAGHRDMRDINGALVCQDWPGLPPGTDLNTADAGLTSDHYLSAADITEDTRIHGMIGFHFACFGAGTPRYDSFAHASGDQPLVLAEKPFVARLPQRMMAHPKGGALAVIGHVDRVWSLSFKTSSAGDQIGPFRQALSRLLRGQSVGRAMKEFNERYAALCVYLVCLQQNQEAGHQIEQSNLAELLTECHDAQNYVILGDPAVHLRVGDMR